MVGCVQSVMGKNKFLVLFEDRQQKDIGSCLFVYLNEKDEVEKDRFRVWWVRIIFLFYSKMGIRKIWVLVRLSI